MRTSLPTAGLTAPESTFSHIPQAQAQYQQVYHGISDRVWLLVLLIALLVAVSPARAQCPVGNLTLASAWLPFHREELVPE